MNSFSERLLDGATGALIGSIGGAIAGTVAGLISYYLNKNIIYIPYIKSFHNPIFASLPLKKVLRMAALTTALCIALFLSITIAFSDFKNESKKNNWILINEAAFQCASIALMITLRKVGIMGNNMTTLISLALVASAARCYYSLGLKSKG